MKLRCAACVATALLIAAGTPAQATVVDFDSNVHQIPEWGGLGWTYFYAEGFYWGDPGWAIVSDGYMAQFGNSFDSPSGDNAVFNGGLSGAQQTLTVVSQFGAFDFDGVRVATWGRDNLPASFSASQLTVEGYRADVLVGSLVVNLSADQYQWVGAGFQGVTELRFSAEAPGKYWLLDDLTYTAASPVPEQSTLSLMGLGLLGLGLIGPLGQRVRRGRART